MNRPTNPVDSTSDDAALGLSFAFQEAKDVLHHYLEAVSRLEGRAANLALVAAGLAGVQVSAAAAVVIGPPGESLADRPLAALVLLLFMVSAGFLIAAGILATRSGAQGNVAIGLRLADLEAAWRTHAGHRAMLERAIPAYLDGIRHHQALNDRAADTLVQARRLLVVGVTASFAWAVSLIIVGATP